MRHKSVFFTVVCLILAAILGTNTAFANTVDDAQSVIDGIAMFKMSEAGAESLQEWADGAICEGAGADSDAYAYALYKLGVVDVSHYKDALLEYLDANEVRSATTRLKYALCLCMDTNPEGAGAASGANLDGQSGAAQEAAAYIARTLEDSIGRLGIMSLVYGLHLASNGQIGNDYSVERILSEIMDLRHEDGGWSVMGDHSDVDVTAMVLQSLAGAKVAFAEDTVGSVGAAKDSTSDSKESLSAVREMVEDGILTGLAFLSEKQKDDGDYSGFGSDNAESTAQVLIAITSLGINPETDERFIKNGKTVVDGLLKYRLPDGTFSHIPGGGSNGTATSQAFTAIAALVSCKEGEPYYIVGPAKYIRPENPQTGEKTGEEARGENTGAPGNPGTDGGSLKTGILLGILGLAIIASALLFIFKKRNWKNFLFVLIVAAIAATFVFFSDFKTESEYYSGGDTVERSIGEATLSIRCDTVAGEGDPDIPEDGIILDTTTYAFGEDETVYDILVRAVRNNKIHMEVKKTGSGPKDYYICGIANIYEYDWGDLSGWMYYVNGESPSVGCGEYYVKPGDRIEWHYTREIGKDINSGKPANMEAAG
ncbi:MAG: DUF4430 domain-containing protein [Lachnospiraceae bacterium]|nr:DUF4430 domain-containing protein [Lachnospiraceae bacterium]